MAQARQAVALAQLVTWDSRWYAEMLYCSYHPHLALPWAATASMALPTVSSSPRNCTGLKAFKVLPNSKRVRIPVGRFSSLRFREALQMFVYTPETVAVHCNQDPFPCLDLGERQTLAGVSLRLPRESS